jgi:hypothetical protein
MKADIYDPTVTRNATNGMVSKDWALTQTINCVARGLLGSKLGNNSANVSIKDQVVLNKDFIKIRTSIPISASSRVVAIRTGATVIWKEDYIANSKGGVSGATIFEPRGSTPILNFDGTVIEFETVLERQEVQVLEGL